MTEIYILIGGLILLNIVVISLYLSIAKRLPPPEEDTDLYDENGNHIYYDRKLIARLEREKNQKGL